MVGFLTTALLSMSLRAPELSPHKLLLHSPDCSNLPRGDTVTDANLRDRYIVTISDSTADPQVLADTVLDDTTELLYTFREPITGFAAKLSVAEVRRLCERSEVASIEPDAYVSLGLVDEAELLPDLGSGGGGGTEAVGGRYIRRSVDWALDRISKKNPSYDSTYTAYATGNGVSIYVVDSGIRVTHSEFGGRATNDFDAMSDNKNGQDCFGHGTHVAGIIAGNTFGVAPGALIHSIRVLDCHGYGTVSSVLKGLEWIAQNAHPPAIVNLSLGVSRVSKNTAQLDSALQSLASNGFLIITAAGNRHRDACRYTPSYLTGTLITVAAADQRDTRWNNSNFGECVAIFAPGARIPSAWRASDSAVASLSGTSMATAFVSGAAALELEKNPTASPPEIRAKLLQSIATHVRDALSANDGLLFVGEIR